MDTSTESIKVALIQTATHWHDITTNLAMFDDWLARVSPQTQLIVLPEMFTTGFTMASQVVAQPMDGEAVQWMQRQAAKQQAVVCGSLVVHDQNHFYNRLIWAMPDGSLQHYDKRHLFRMAGEHDHYAPGAKRPVFDYLGWRFCPIVCYDLRFPVWLRNSATTYDVIVCVANWPMPRREAWDTLLTARAIENQAYVIAVNIVGTDGNGVEYGGHSAVYGPEGSLLSDRSDQEGVIEVTLPLETLTQLRRDFPVWRDADAFNLVSE